MSLTTFGLASPSASPSPIPTASSAIRKRSSRRGSTRRDVVLPCQAVREHDFVLVAERTLDVSVEGVLLPIQRRVLTGETLIVSFQIPGTWIDAECTVTRVIHGRRPGDEGMAAGVVFDVLSASSRAALAGYLHGRPPPLPRRGPLARLRRGLDAPQLADQSVMNDVAIAPPSLSDLADVADVEDVADDADFDTRGAVQVVASAWKRLVSEA
jgi:hypothetical protein